MRLIAEDTDEREKFLISQFKPPQDILTSMPFHNMLKIIPVYFLGNPLQPIAIEVISPQGKIINFLFMFLYLVFFFYLLYSLNESLEQKGAIAG